MTITAPQPTPLQKALKIEIALNGIGNILPISALNAINLYTSIVNTPTVLDLALLIEGIEAAKSTVNSAHAAYILNALEDLARIEFLAQKIGSPEEGLILNNSGYPLDDLGVTNASIVALLIKNLNDTSISNASDLAAAIYYAINAQYPYATLAKLTDDIQATIDDTGITLTVLVAKILASLISLSATPTNDQITNAVYGRNVLSADAAHLVRDIYIKEQLNNFNAIKANVINASSDNNTGPEGYAQALYDSLLGLPSHQLELSRLKDIVAASASGDNLSALKANIISNQSITPDFETTAQSITDGLFALNALTPLDPHSLQQDLIAANKLLGLQHITQALIASTANFTGDATALAIALIASVVSNQGGNSLSRDELINDIEASGDIIALAHRINSALTGLDQNMLTSPKIVAAIYGNNLIISGHKQDLLDDLQTSEIILNYQDMKAILATAIYNALSPNELAYAIYNHVGNTHNLSLDALKLDVLATLDSGTNLSALKLKLVAGLNTASPALEDIISAIYNKNNGIISADPVLLMRDIENVEAAIDYRKLILALQDVCNKVTVSPPQITTPIAFAVALSGAVSAFGGPTTLDILSVANEITFNAVSLPVLAAAIYLDLADANTNQEFTAMAIDAAIFNNISPSHPTRSYADIIATEELINLYGIKNAIIAACIIIKNDNNSTSDDFAAALIIAIANNNSFPSTLQLVEMSKDISATLVTANISLAILAGNIIDNLNAIDTNALTPGLLKDAIYAINTISSGNAYGMEADITSAELTLGSAIIKANLLNYLSDIYSNQTDISAITMAKGILSNISSTLTPNITANHLAAAIAYTTARLDVEYGDGHYKLAGALVTELTNASNTPEDIHSALLRVLIMDSIADDDTSGDAAKLLLFIKTVDSSYTGSYITIAAKIVSNLTSLTGSCSNDDIAIAIINAIGANNPWLLVDDLLSNIAATSGYAHPLFLASAIADAVVNQNTASGIASAIFGLLAPSNANAGDLLLDIGVSTRDSNDYPIIVADILSGLQALPTNYTINDVALAIVIGLDYITNGPNGVNSSPNLSVAQVLDDIAQTIAASHTSLAGLVGDLQNALAGLNNGSISPADIVAAIYSINTIQTAHTNAGALNVDLGAAETASNSLPDIRSNFANVGAYNTPTELAIALLQKIVSDTGVVPSLTVLKLAADIDDTLANDSSITLQGLANKTFQSMSEGDYTLWHSDSVTDSVFGDNVQTRDNEHLLKRDIDAYKVTREPDFYDIIANNLKGVNFNSFNTATGFAGGLVGALNVGTPEWNLARAAADVTASITGSDTPSALGTRIIAALDGISGPSTSVKIVDALYNANTLRFAQENANDLTGDIGNDKLFYYELSSRITTALQNQPSTNFNEGTIADIIVKAITPVAVNPTPNLPAADFLADVSYTERSMPVSLREITGCWLSKLGQLTVQASSENLDNAIYNTDCFVASNNDPANFVNDIITAARNYNDYAALQTALQNLATSSPLAMAASILSDVALLNNHLEQQSLATDILNTQATTNTGLEDLANNIVNNLVEAEASDVSTAAINLARAFFSNIIAPSAGNLGLDVSSAVIIDNAVSLTSAIGSHGVCSVGATHSVYSCSMSPDNIVTVGSVVATNDCTITGLSAAMSACSKFISSHLGSDFYFSRDGISCSDYLDDAAARVYCEASLDYLV